MQLAALRRLRKLSVSIKHDDTCNCLAAEAAVFLRSLSGCGTVLLKLPASSAPFVDALAALHVAGLAPPCVEIVARG